MKKITSAKFQKNFSKVVNGLNAGETVQVTRHGKVIGQYNKTMTIRRRRIGNSIPMPKGDPKAGQGLLDKLFHDCLS